ncbi:MAG: hypothetical protein KatS3mg023_1433 [Armatimonadota bacterium]|nr:MAG: hypothetical protein KatS3mg023_1433 [Armatimonadota bacterium]
MITMVMLTLDGLLYHLQIKVLSLLVHLDPIGFWGGERKTIKGL